MENENGMSDGFEETWEDFPEPEDEPRRFSQMRERFVCEAPTEAEQILSPQR